MNNDLIVKIKNSLTNADYRFLILSRYGLYNWMSDEKFLKRKFKILVGHDLDLQNPKTFNEKLQWIKIHDRKPIYTTMVDKYAVKQYVADKTGGKQYIIPTYGVWDSFDDIDFDSLPNQFVLKCTHDSGGLVIVRDKTSFDRKKAKQKLNKRLRMNYYWGTKEWPYKDVKPRILAEQYLEDKGNLMSRELIDYKFYCFNGEPGYLSVSKGLENQITARRCFLTLDWNFAPFRKRDYAAFEELPQKPEHFSDMLALAKELANGFDFLRVDLYEVNQQIYFSELTFTPSSGMMPFVPEDWDLKLGEMLKLTGKDT